MSLAQAAGGQVDEDSSAPELKADDCDAAEDKDDGNTLVEIALWREISVPHRRQRDDAEVQRVERRPSCGERVKRCSNSKKAGDEDEVCTENTRSYVLRLVHGALCDRRRRLKRLACAHRRVG